MDEGSVGSAHFPAAVVPDMAIGDHYPLLLPAPCEMGEEHFRTRRLKIGDLTEEDWAIRDTNLGRLLDDGEDMLGKAEGGSRVRHNDVPDCNSITLQRSQSDEPIERFFGGNPTLHLIDEIRAAKSRNDVHNMERG